MSSLDPYRAKRDFGATPEPAGATEPEPAGAPRFVIQEHHATALHWDLRLERDGVLVSWAVPKGIPPDPRVNHLAVHTEDHPLEYLDFEGHIPDGNYGAGDMAVWDTGTYEPEKVEEKEVIVVFHGDRVRGRYALIRTGGNQWLLHRMDPAEDPTRELLPEGLSPMQSTPGPLPTDEEEWAFEVAWGGQVIVVAFDGGRPASAIDVGGDNLVGRVPELNRLGEALGTVQVVLHGEIVVLGEDGRPDRARLEARLAARSPSTVRRLARDRPALFMIGDLLWLDGHAAMDLPWHGRRQLLDELALAGDRWQTPPAHPGEGRPLLDATSAQGLPGIVAKRLDSPYQPGVVSSAWRSIAAAATAAATGDPSTTAPT